jgi:hypothetical protein
MPTAVVMVVTTPVILKIATVTCGNDDGGNGGGDGSGSDDNGSGNAGGGVTNMTTAW